MLYDGVDGKSVIKVRTSMSTGMTLKRTRLVWGAILLILGGPLNADTIAAALDTLVPELMVKYHVPGVSIVGIENRRIA